MSVMDLLKRLNVLRLKESKKKKMGYGVNYFDEKEKNVQ